MVTRHRRRWRSPSAWLLATLPWFCVGGTLGLRLLPGVHGHAELLIAQVALAAFYTAIVISLWKPWKKEE